jgi:hypothetical protein
MAMWATRRMFSFRAANSRILRPGPSNHAQTRPAGYGCVPFTIPEVVKMSSLKPRLYPILITAIGILAATGGAWRIG